MTLKLINVNLSLLVQVNRLGGEGNREGHNIHIDA